MMHSISDLIPYSSNAVLNSLFDRIRILKLLMFFYNAIKEAAQSFVVGKYEDFDAQVSENLCQIRAYQMILSVEEKEKYCGEIFNILKEVNEVQNKCKILFDEYQILSQKRPSHYTHILDKSITFIDWLKECKLYVSFGDFIYFLSQNYILSKYKLVGDFNISQGINYENFCGEIKVSKTYARKIIHKLQRNISELSCRFIFKILGKLEADQYRHFFLKALYHQDEVGRHVMPCYEVTKIILQHALHTKKLVQVVVTRISQNEKDTVKFMLLPSLEGGDYELATIDEICDTEGIVTFTGIVQYGNKPLDPKEAYISRFLKVGFKDIILSNMAQHPQYAGLLLDNKKYNPYLSLDSGGFLSLNEIIRHSESDFLKHKNLSKEVGCSADNASLFLLTHVRCESIFSELEGVNASMKTREILLVA